METAGYSIAAVLLTILCRDGLPALVRLLPALGKFLSGRTADGRAVTADDREAERKDEATAVAELKKLVAMLQADGTDNRQQIHELRDLCNKYAVQAAACEAREAAKDERIAALEDGMTRAGIPFHKRPSDGSGPHRPHSEGRTNG